MKVSEIAKLDKYEVFGELLRKLRNKEGKSIIFTPKNIYPNDDFLIFSAWKSCEVIFTKTRNGLWYLKFSNDEPMLLEDTPDSFRRSILLNLE